MDFEKAKKWLKPRLNEEKYMHSLGAEKTARELAKMFSVDEEKAAFAGLIHDNAKDIPYKEMLELIETNNFQIDEDVKSNEKILHAYVGSCLAEKELNISDQKILNAVKFHTTGRVNMTLFEKIIFLADKIEENTRNADFRNKVLSLLKDANDIDKAILFCIDSTIRSLLDRKLPINSITIDVWNDYVTKKNT